MEYPDFFIVGAPKTGTTSLSDALDCHPEIAMLPGEPHFFGSDIADSDVWIRDPHEYEQLVNAARARGRLVGEKSVWYLYSQTACDEISAANENARIIIMLREPAALLYSLYHYWRAQGVEDAATFQRALALEPERKQLHRVPTMVRRYPSKFLYYREILKLDTQVERYLQRFDRSRVLFVLADRFGTNPENELARVHTFLGVPPKVQGVARVKNQGRMRSLRRPLLRRIVRNSATVALYRRLVPKQGNRHPLELLAHRFSAATSTYEPIPPVQPGVRRELTDEFAPMVERLASLTNLDLSHWNQ